MDAEQREPEERTETKHGLDASEKTGADGAKQRDTPSAEDVASEGEGTGLGGRTGAQGDGTETEPGGGRNAGERRK
jgi:hypothetical protein